MNPNHDQRVSAFYCVANADYFLGLVALLNSLRLVGHQEPVFVLDAGLDNAQRERLRPHVTIVEAPESLPPALQKWHLPLAHPAAAMVLIDTDIVLTGRLDPLISEALDGKIAALVDGVLPDRFYPSWGELLDLGEVQQHPYVNTGLLVLPEIQGTRVLTCAQELQAIRAEVIQHARNTKTSHPLCFGDQDLFNAILAARVNPDQLVVFEHRLAPFHHPAKSLRLIDESTLRCSYPDGTAPLALHHVGPKPWLGVTADTMYTRLLPRILLGDDVELRLDPDDVPPRFHEGTRGKLERTRINLQTRLGPRHAARKLRRRVVRRARRGDFGESMRRYAMTRAGRLSS